MAPRTRHSDADVPWIGTGIDMQTRTAATSVMAIAGIVVGAALARSVSISYSSDAGYTINTSTSSSTSPADSTTSPAASSTSPAASTTSPADSTTSPAASSTSQATEGPANYVFACINKSGKIDYLEFRLPLPHQCWFSGETLWHFAAVPAIAPSPTPTPSPFPSPSPSPTASMSATASASVTSPAS
jgi:hypothetical protein